MKRLKVVDLFSGCGGLSLGLEAADLKIVVGVDSDKDAIKTFGRAHPETDAVCEDVGKWLDNGHIPALRRDGVDLLVGGPPCQGFCAINPKRSKKDPRNSCVNIFLRSAEELKPRFVLMENVTGLISLAGGYALKKVAERLSSLGYTVSLKVLQAAHYGVPQSRWRLFIAASSRGAFEFPQPTHGARIRANIPGGHRYVFRIEPEDDLFHRYVRPTNVRDAIGDLPAIDNGGGENLSAYGTPPQNPYQQQLRKGSTELRNHIAGRLGASQLERVRALSQGMSWRDLPENLIPDNLRRLREKYGEGLGCRSRFGRLSWDGLFSTILTQPHPYWGAFFHPEQDRLISVREAARAQSFPDRITFTGPVTSQFRQVGNAVPPLLAESVGRQIRKHISEVQQGPTVKS